MSEVQTTLRAKNKGSGKETQVAKTLAFLGTGVANDPIETIIGDILMVHSTYGHIASVQEVEEELRAPGRVGSIPSDMTRSDRGWLQRFGPQKVSPIRGVTQ